MLSRAARRGTWRHLLAPLLVLTLIGAAFAQGGSAPIDEIAGPTCAPANPDQKVAHAAEWVCVVARLANRINLYGWVDGIAWAVLLAAFVARTLMISLDPNAGPKLRNFLTVAALSFGIMLSLNPVRSSMFDVWKGVYDYSNSVGSSALWGSLAEFAETLNIEGAAAGILGGAIVSNYAPSVAAAADAPPPTRSVRISRLKGITGGVGKVLKSTAVFRIIDMILLPILSLHSMIVFGSALIIMVGSLLLPIGAIMMITGSGASFFSNWVNVMLASLLTVAIFPLMWGVAVDVAIATPMVNLFQDLETIQKEHAATLAEISSSNGPWWDIAGVTEATRMVGAHLMAGWQSVSSILGLALQLIIGVVTAFGLIFLLQTVITRFLSGVVSQAKNFGSTFGSFGGGKLKGGAGKGPGAETTRGGNNAGGSSSSGSGPASGAPLATGGSGPARPAAALQTSNYSVDTSRAGPTFSRATSTLDQPPGPLPIETNRT